MSDGAYTPLREQMGGRTKVCIVGFCTTNRDLTPYKDPSWEIWGLNRGHLFMERADRWFEMHERSIILSQVRRPGRHIDWLNAFPGPVYMHQKFPEIKTAVEYPLKEMAAYFGPNIIRVGTWGRPEGKGESSSGSEQWVSTETIRNQTEEPYLTSSIAYEIALAIYEGYEEIALFGVDLSTDAEYAWQVPGVEFLLGVAIGKGIKVLLPDNCPRVRGTLYGRGFMSERPEHMSYESLETRMKSLQKEMEAIVQELNRAVGGHMERQFLMEQMMPGIDHELADQRHKQSAAVVNALQGRVQQTQGKIEETAYWLSQTPQGQEPKEAIEQLLKTAYKNNLVVEGPQSDYEENVEPWQSRQHINGSVDVGTPVAPI